MIWTLKVSLLHKCTLSSRPHAVTFEIVVGRQHNNDSAQSFIKTISNEVEDFSQFYFSKELKQPIKIGLFGCDQICVFNFGIEAKTQILNTFKTATNDEDHQVCI